MDDNAKTLITLGVLFLCGFATDATIIVGKGVIGPAAASSDLDAYAGTITWDSKIGDVLLPGGIALTKVVDSHIAQRTGRIPEESKEEFLVLEILQCDGVVLDKGR